MLEIIHSQKEDGNMAIKYGVKDEIIAKKRAFFENHHIDYERTVCLNVDNKDHIVEVTEDMLQNHFNENHEIAIDADALITTIPNLFLYLNFGDCVPFVLFDTKQNILAFAHLGWRSIDCELHQKLIHYFESHYNSNINDLTIYIGPAIEKESYLLDHTNHLEKNRWGKYIYPINHQFAIDLKGKIVDDVIQLGIAKDKIEVSPIDVGKTWKEFSHYYSTKHNISEGRFLLGARIVE